MRVFDLLQVILTIWMTTFYLSLLKFFKELRWDLVIEFLAWILLGILLWLFSIHLVNMGIIVIPPVLIATPILYMCVIIGWYFISFPSIKLLTKLLVSLGYTLFVYIIVAFMPEYFSHYVLYGLFVSLISFIFVNL